MYLQCKDVIITKQTSLKIEESRDGSNKNKRSSDGN